MNLVRSRSWGQLKPPPGSQIDSGHSLAEGLAVCFTFNEGIGKAVSLVNSADVMSPTGTVQQQAAASGPGLYCPTTAGNNYMTGTAVSSAANLSSRAGASIFWFGTFMGNGNVGSGNRVMIWQAANIGLARDTTGASGAKPGILFLNPFNSTNVNLSINSRYGQAISLGFTYHNSGSGTWNTFSNGALLTTGNPGGAVNLSGSTYTLSDTNASAGTPNMLTTMVVAWNRPLSPDEMAWIGKEPYAFIAPPGPKILYIDLAPPPPGTARALEAKSATASKLTLSRVAV